MNEDDLKKLFQEVGQTQSDDLMRQRAKRAALAAFDASSRDHKVNVTQGKLDTQRLIPEVQQTNRSKHVNTKSKTWLTRGVAVAAVLVLSVSIFPQLIRHDAKAPLTDVKVLQRDSEPAVLQGLEKPERRQTQDMSTTKKELSVDAKVEAESSPVVDFAASPSQSSDASLQTWQVYGWQSINAESTSAIRSEGVPERDLNVLPMQSYRQDSGRDRFDTVDQNPVKRVVDEPMSTFSIDVDTASYSFVRRMLNQGVLPQKDAVRLEEMVNYFPYDYTSPVSPDAPFKTNIVVMDSPWKPGNKLVQIGIKGYELVGEQPRSNLVFLLDVSGSMNSPDKLPLVKQSMAMLLDQLRPDDSVAIAVYAGAAGTVLSPTPAKERQKILQALQRLGAGGSTAGTQGIQLAYQLAESAFIEDGINRIILATDGDFNVGITNRDELKGFVERKRASGIFLSVLGFGQGNYHDHLMQTLAQNGNGIAAYIDTLSEAQKVLIDEATATLFPIAKDVKIQVEFNPATVTEYRLLGYETRMLKQEDFNNDVVDAGDIGAGHTVTAIYEITPVNANSGLFDRSRYQVSSKEGADSPLLSDEYGMVKVRYKLINHSASKLITEVIPSVNSPSSTKLARESRFATAVAGFAQLLKGGKYIGQWSLDDALELAQANKGEDPYGYRTELTQLIRKAKIAKALP